DLDAGPLALQQHGDAGVTLAPATVHRLRELFQRQVGDTHRHADFSSELRGQSYVLVRQAQGEARRVVLALDERVEAVEHAAAAAGALADGLPQRDRRYTGLDAHREALGQRRLNRVAGAVVHQLGNRAGADRSDVLHLVAQRVEHRPRL